jgi:hypothetical protein
MRRDAQSSPARSLGAALPLQPIVFRSFILKSNLFYKNDQRLVYCSFDAAQQSVTKFIAMIVINLVTPKAGAKHELLFNKLASYLNVGSAL